MGWSLLDIWVLPLNRHVNTMGLMLDRARHVWVQTDDLDAQGTIIVPACLNEPLLTCSTTDRAAWIKRHLQSAHPAPCWLVP